MTRALALPLLAVATFACHGRQTADTPATPVGDPARTSADDLVRQVQEAYGGAQHLVARFRLTSVDKRFGLRTAQDGVIYFKRPGDVRLDFVTSGGPSRGQVARTLFVGRTRMWAVEVRDRWYVELPRSSGAVAPAILFLTDTRTLSVSFDARVLTPRAHGAGDVILELRPKAPSARLARLVLVVDSSTRRVRKTIATNAAGDTTELSFFTHDTEQRVAASWFVFDPKAAAARGFRQVTPGQLPPIIKPRPAPSPAASGEKDFLSEDWLRAYHDCDRVRAARPPRDHPPSLADMQRCAFPAAPPRQQLPSRRANRR